MSTDGVLQLVIDQVTKVQVEQPALELVLAYTGEMVVRGTVRFSIDHGGRAYKDSYEVEITIRSDYPASMPTVKETAGAIPADFHRFIKTGDLCLAAPVELVRVFAQDHTVRHYINRLLIPYLFSYTYFREHGQLPHGELSHGLLGVLEYYQEFFAVGPLTAMKLLKLLADSFAPPLMPCPCNSGGRLQDCHGPKLNKLRPLLPSEHFARDLRKMITMARSANIPLPEREVTPKRTLRNREKRRRKEVQRR